MQIKSLFFLFLMVVLLSCNSNKEDGSQIGNNRLAKIVYPSDQYVLDFRYNYNSNNCNSIYYATNNYLINYYYENNQLIQSFRNNNQYDYQYENNKISQITVKYGASNNISEKYKYFYNSNNQISEVESYFLQNGNLNFIDNAVYYYDSNGNNYKREHLDANSTLVTYEVFTFDNKNNLFKNFEPKITLMEYFPFGNNVKSIRYYQANGTQSQVTNYSYEYNSNGYPTKATISNSVTSDIDSIEYYYE